MPDLKDVEKRIAELKAEIEPVTRELAALEDLARNLKAFGRGEPLTRSKLPDFQDLTMPEAAAQVLIENFEQGNALSRPDQDCRKAGLSREAD